MKLRTLLEDVSSAAFGLERRQGLELQRAFSLSSDYAEFRANRLGRGGGPDATPFTVALIAIAAWSGKPRSTEAWSFASLFYNPITAGSDAGHTASVIVGSELPFTLRPCTITGRGCFGDALSAIFDSSLLALRLGR